MAITKYTNQQLASWFEDKAKDAAGIRRSIVNTETRAVDNTIIGTMYFFKYDPKWKHILPIYDKFPMVFPIERYLDGFLGLNLHYLNTDERLSLLGRLTKFASNANLTPNTRLKLSYDLLQSSRALSTESRPCVKRYLYSHVRSKFIQVLPAEWEKAAQLPIELFVTNKTHGRYKTTI
jgi:hypothetical protein